MSYPMDLDQYTDDRLRDELTRRSRERKEEKCAYCLRDQVDCKKTPCAFPNCGEPR
jgi:hypothetical protein